MIRAPHTPGETWPRLMRAATAAAYLDEKSVEAFRRRVGSLYPKPVNVIGRGELWLREQLDEFIDTFSARVEKIKDIADVL